MKHLIILLTIFSFISIAAIAQKTVKGKVTDADTKNPLAGATISFAGKGGTTTDKDGQFSIDCGKTNRITVSFVGYEPVQVIIKNCDDELNILLAHAGHLLNEVEITATSNQNKSILYQPSSITKLTTTELKRSNGLYLDDAINGNVPGVTMQRRAVSSGQSFNIRGYGNGVRGTNGVSSNFDGQGSKVYLNGIPVTDAEGITVMDDIDFGSIGNVEVTKGPAGTLYGLAVSGVVNLKTIKPEKGKTSIGQDVMFGSYGLKRFTSHFQMSTEHSSLLVNYGHQTSDGFFLHNASTKNFVNIAGDFELNAKQTLNTYFGYSNSYDERAGELTLDQYKNFDYSGNPAYIKNNAHSEVIGFRAGVTHTYAFSSSISNTTTVYGSGITNNASSAGGWTDKDPVNYGLRSTFDTKFSLSQGFSLSGITGVETQKQRAQTIGYAMVADSNNLTGYNRIGAMRSNQFTISGTTSLFTEWTLAMPNDFSLTAGIGWSNMKIELNDRFYVASANRVPTKFSKTYDGMVSPHVAINKVFSREFSVYASYSKGYKAPVSSYFFIPYVTGAAGTGIVNNNLKPEIGNQFEIGTKGALMSGKLSYQLAIFDAKFSNKMTAVTVQNAANTVTLYSYIVNGGKQDDKGLEALLKYTAYQSSGGFFATVSPFVNFTYSDFKYKDYTFHTKNKAGLDSAILYDGKAVAGVPKFVGNIGIDVTTNPGLYANVTYSYKDGFPITSDGLFNSSSYSLLNAKIGFQRSLSNHFDIDLYAGANNITGTQYPIMVFVNQLPDAYLPAPYKINYFGGLNLKYIF